MLEVKTAEVTPPPTEAEIKRASDIAVVMEKVTTLKERETISIRPCCQDIIFAYKAIEGIGRPDNLSVNIAALWEDEPLAKIDALTAMLDDLEAYFVGYSYPPKPIEELK
jgi:hypothetical protein